MRPIRKTVVSATVSPWVPIDYLQGAIQVAVAVEPWSTATGLTATVQQTFDDLKASNPVTWTRAGTTVTVTDTGPPAILTPGHGLVTGDSIILKGSGSSNIDSPLDLSGNGDLGWTVTVTSATTYTFTTANTGPTSGQGFVTQLRVSTVTGFSAVNARTFGNIGYPVTAVRLNVSALTAGAVDINVLQGA